jgi:hypothetical protein
MRVQIFVAIIKIYGTFSDFKLKRMKSSITFFLMQRRQRNALFANLVRVSFCLVYSKTVKMEMIYSSETSLYIFPDYMAMYPRRQNSSCQLLREFQIQNYGVTLSEVNWRFLEVR